MKRFKAVVIGGTGYGGAELIRRLLIHPEVELARVVAVDHVGEPLGAVHPPLTGRSAAALRERPARRGGARRRRRAAGAAPQGQRAPRARDPRGGREGGRHVGRLPPARRRRLRALLRRARTRTPSCSGTLRLRPARAEPRGDPRRRARSRRPAASRRRSSSGLLPLARAGKLAGAVVHVVGMTGSSGSGIAPTAGTHHPVRAVNLKTYKVLEHQHTPEILETLAAAGAPGVELRLRAGVGAAVARHPGDQLRRAARRHRPRRRSPRSTQTRTGASRSSASCAIGCPRSRRSRAATTPRSASRWAPPPAATGTRTLAIVSATDNLIKGGAGQAIQNMNLMLGLPETMSLEDPGPWP